jgi:VWFA-related protein
MEFSVGTDGSKISNYRFCGAIQCDHQRSQREWLNSAQIGASERGVGSTYALTTGNESQSRRNSQSLAEDVMAEFADGTHGPYFHDSNDLTGGLKNLTAEPEYIYLLEFSLKNGKQDGTYRHLKVKVDQQGLKLQARRGYFAPKAANNKN